MKKSKFSETQIVKFLNENEAGRSVADICRELGIAQGTFYRWRKKYAGMDAAQLSLYASPINLPLNSRNSCFPFHTYRV